MLTDMELSEKAKQAMIRGEYDIAINNVRRMQNTVISTKMELLIIEHEQAVLRENTTRVNFILLAQSVEYECSLRFAETCMENIKQRPVESWRT